MRPNTSIIQTQRQLHSRPLILPAPETRAAYAFVNPSRGKFDSGYGWNVSYDTPLLISSDHYAFIAHLSQGLSAYLEHWTYLPFCLFRIHVKHIDVAVTIFLELYWLTIQQMRIRALGSRASIFSWMEVTRASLELVIFRNAICIHRC